MRPDSLPRFPSLRPLLLPSKRTYRSPLSATFFSQLPTLFAILLTDVVVRNTLSGYSVMIITLLASVLYVSLRSGTKQGLLSAILVVFYNFYLVSSTTGTPFFSLETLNSDWVIGVAFPVLAAIVGQLKERNDSLLEREQSARLRAEDSARQFQFMAESMPQKIFTMLPSGRSQYANRQWHEYTGDITNQTQKQAEANWANVVHPADYDENQRLWKHSLHTGDSFQFEHRLKRNDGTYRWHLTRANPLRDQSGKISLWIGSSTDIEDVRKTKKLEADTARLIKQRAQLMELNSVKDEFISLASHQLRTPATGVKQYINMALDGYGGLVSDKLRVLLEKANDSNERQLAVINDLLQVAQVDAGKVVLRKEQIDLQALITSIVQEQQSKFSKRGQRVRFEDPKKKLSIMVDPTKFRMVLENIIDNASKYSPDGANVTIRTMSSRGKVRVTVTDEGVGIKKGDLDKVFQKFMRIDNPMSKVVGGSGLGLYWVKRIIDMHDGEITVSSHPGKGSVFTITLPTSESRASRRKT